MSSIRTRLAWQLAWPSALVFGILCVTVYAAARYLIEARQQQYLENTASVISNIARESGTAGLTHMQSRLTFYAERRPATRLEIRRANGKYVYTDSATSPHMLSHHTRSHEFAIELPELDASPLAAQLELDIAIDHGNLSRVAWLLLISSTLGSIFVGALSFWRTRRELAPLIALAQKTQQADVTRPLQPIALAPIDEELEPLLRQFNALLNRVNLVHEELEAFNASAAHELRAPLAGIIGQCEVALARPRNNHELQETLHLVLDDARRLAGIVSDMLFLARADATHAAPRMQAVSLAALGDQVIEFHEASLEERHLSATVQGDAVAKVDADLIKRALSNLLGNAIRYASTDSTIDLVIGAQGADSWSLAVNIEKAVDRTESKRKARPGMAFGPKMEITQWVSQKGGETLR